MLIINIITKVVFCHLSFDSRFTDRIAAEDEESFNILNRVIFSFLRAGRIDEAKGLVEKLAIPTMLNIIAMREFLTEPALSPTDPLDDNFNLSKSRLFFKEMVKNLLQMRTVISRFSFFYKEKIKCDERIQRADHCIWATVSGNLHTLLSYANNSEDRLWSYLSCAAESIFDNALLEVHSKHNDELNKIRVYDNSELPLDISSIFRELNNVFNVYVWYESMVFDLLE